MMLFAWGMSALEHFTLLSPVHTFWFWVNCLCCTLAVHFYLQEKPVCWHYTQLITYLGSITVNCRIYRLKQYSSLYGWKVKLTLCLTSTIWLRCSWGKAPHIHTHLTSALEVSAQVHVSQESVFTTNWTGGHIGPRDGPDISMKTKFLLLQGLTARPCSLQPSHYTHHCTSYIFLYIEGTFWYHHTPVSQRHHFTITWLLSYTPQNASYCKNTFFLNE